MSISLGMNFRPGNGIHQAKGPSESFEVLSKVISFQSPLSSFPNQSVTGVGFQPKTVTSFGSLRSTNGAGTGGCFSFGSCASANSCRSSSIGASHGVTTTSTTRNHSNSLQYMTFISTSSFVRGRIKTFGVDGFTNEWDSVSGVTRYLFSNFALAGSTLEANLVQCRMNGTNSSESFAHGLSGEPVAILLFSAQSATTPATIATATNLFFSVGAWAGGNQFGASLWSNSGVTTTASKKCLSSSHSIARIENSIERSLSISSVDATNVNVTYPDTVSTSQDYFWMLCLRGCKAKVGTFNLNGSLDPLVIPCAGINPKLFVPVFIPDGVTSLGTVTSSAVISIGAYDGSSVLCSGFSDRSGVSTSEIRSFQSSTALVDYDSSGNLIVSATPSFSVGSVTIDPTTNSNSSWGQGGYLIIGE